MRSGWMAQRFSVLLGGVEGSVSIEIERDVGFCGLAWRG